MPTQTPTKPSKRAAKKAVAPEPSVRRLKKYEEPRPQVQTRLPAELIERIDVEAARRHVSKTYLIETIIATSLGDWEKQNI